MDPSVPRAPILCTPVLLVFPALTFPFLSVCLCLADSVKVNNNCKV